MSIIYTDKAHVDTGMEWGQMWLLEMSSAERNVSYSDGHEADGVPGTVRRVLVARRRWRGSRDRGYVFRHFVRLPDREYGPTEYMTVLDGPANKYLFLTEVDAWKQYADSLARRLDHYRQLVQIGEQMLAETEAIVRMKRGQ